MARHSCASIIRPVRVSSVVRARPSTSFMFRELVTLAMLELISGWPIVRGRHSRQGPAREYPSSAVPSGCCSRALTAITHAQTFSHAPPLLKALAGGGWGARVA
jgi:hypothetical protein